MGQRVEPRYKVDEEDGEKPKVILLTDCEMILACTLAQREHLEVVSFCKMKRVWQFYFKTF